MKYLIILITTFSININAKFVTWESVCPSFNERAFDLMLIKKCIDKECKIKSTKSTLSGFGGRYNSHRFFINASNNSVKVAYPSNLSLGEMSKAINRLCPSIKVTKSQSLVVKSLPKGYRNFIFHLSDKEYKSHWFYKQFKNSKDKCLKLNIVKEKSSVVIYLSSVCKNELKKY